jgi:hypothetical protein
MIKKLKQLFIRKLDLPFLDEEKEKEEEERHQKAMRRIEYLIELEDRMHNTQAALFLWINAAKDVKQNSSLAEILQEIYDLTKSD